MAVYWSDTVRNAVLDAWETAIGTSAVVKLWSGTVPASEAAADATASGTAVATFTLASDWADAAVTGQKSMAQASLPLSVSASNSGTLTHYRIYASNGTTCHEQGTITATGGGGDMTVDSTSVTAAQTVRITAFTKTAPH